VYPLTNTLAAQAVVQCIHWLLAALEARSGSRLEDQPLTPEAVTLVEATLASVCSSSASDQALAEDPQASADNPATAMQVLLPRTSVQPTTQAALLQGLAQQVEVKLDSPVTHVSYTKHGVTVTTKSGMLRQSLSKVMCEAHVSVPATWC
jgi:hypothetical protein